RIEKQERLVISNSAPILHCPAKTPRDSDLVQFRQREFHTEIIIVVAENFFGAFQSVTPLLLLAFCRYHPYLGAIQGILDRFQFARHQYHEVTRHRWSRFEMNLLQSVPE